MPTSPSVVTQEVVFMTTSGARIGDKVGTGFSEKSHNKKHGHPLKELECGTWYQHRDAYSVSWAEIWEFSKSQHDIIDAITI